MALYYETGNGWALTKFARKNLNLDGYLCCPGPSLAKVDENILRGRGRMIFAINTAYPKVKPDVWMGLDNIACYDRNILHEPFMKIFRGTYFEEMKYEGTPVKEFPNTFWASFKEPASGKTMFDYRQHDSPFVWHKNTLAGIIHFMVWLGIKDIYLIGCDMGGNKDYYDDRELTDFQRKYNRKLYTEQINFMRKLAKEGIKHGVVFYSCTPDSPLNKFLDYIPVEQAIKNSEKKVEIKDRNTLYHALDSRTVNVITVLRSGGDYTEEYVYRLQESVKKHLPKSTFTCITDTVLDERVSIIPMKYNISTKEVPQWCKLEMFEHFKTGKNLYLDLSMVVKGDLTPLVSRSGFHMVKDFMNPKFMSSCVMSWEGDYSYLIDKFVMQSSHFNKKYKVDWDKPWESGLDQLYIEDMVKPGVLSFDEGLIASYKRASRAEIDEAVIVKWHGKPRPHEVGWNIYRPEGKPRMRWEVLAKVINDNKLKTVVELGVGHSRTFGYLLEHCPDTNIIGVDAWQKREKLDMPGHETYENWNMEALKQKAVDLMNKYRSKEDPDRVGLLDMTTHEAVKYFEDESIDLVFVDADHTYEGVMNDIRDWYPKIRKEGFMYGHDINWQSVFYGVLHHFREFNKDVDNLWWVRKEE